MRSIKDMERRIEELKSDLKQERGRTLDERYRRVRAEQRLADLQRSCVRMPAEVA